LIKNQITKKIIKTLEVKLGQSKMWVQTAYLWMKPVRREKRLSDFYFMECLSFILESWETELVPETWRLLLLEALARRHPGWLEAG
jgi:hypothetical protein